MSPGAFTLGWQAGESAAGFAGAIEPAELDSANEEAIAERSRSWETILSRKGARVASWREAQASMDYYAGAWRSKSMLDAGLARLDRLRQEARAELGAGNPHELYRCVEILSLMDCAEAIMLSARAREESRFGPEHSRADFPTRMTNGTVIPPWQRERDASASIRSLSITSIGKTG